MIFRYHSGAARPLSAIEQTGAALVELFAAIAATKPPVPLAVRSDRSVIADPLHTMHSIGPRLVAAKAPYRDRELTETGPGTKPTEPAEELADRTALPEAAVAARLEATTRPPSSAAVRMQRSRCEPTRVSRCAKLGSSSLAVQGLGSGTCKKWSQGLWCKLCFNANWEGSVQRLGQIRQHVSWMPGQLQAFQETCPPYLPNLWTLPI